MIESRKVLYRSPDGTRIVGVLQRSPKPFGNIILAHGITTNKEEGGIFARVSDTLCNKGLQILRFDFRGHGESSGSQENMTITGEATDLRSSIEFIRSLDDLPLGILAASFAAGPSIICAAQTDLKISSMVLWNPVLDYRKTFLEPRLPWAIQYFNEEGYRNLDLNGYLLLGNFQIGRELVREMNLTRPYEDIRRLTIPILTFHGDRDTKVPYEVSKKYAICNSKSKLITVSGSDHGFHRKMDEELVINGTVEWFLETLRR